MSATSFSPGKQAPVMLRVLRQAWPQLVAVDLLAKATGFLVIAPLTGLLLRLFAERGGGSVLTDEAILWFFVSPLGVTALVVVGAVALWISFIEHGAMVAIAQTASAKKRVTLRWTYRLIVRRGPAVLRLTATLILRLLVLAGPFVGLMAVVYLTLLTEFDINYYLTVKPPVYWVAAGLMALVALALAATLAAVWVRWVFALPVLLFERGAVREAIQESVALTKGHRWTIAAWLLAWAVTSLLVGASGTHAVATVGKLLIPTQSNSLAVVAFVVGIAGLIALLLNLAVSVVVVSLYGALVERLYMACGGKGISPELLGKRPDALLEQGPLRLSAVVKGIVIVAVASAAVAVWMVGTLSVEDTTQVTAHRGSSMAAPENTLAAVERAIADGADWVEIDVQELVDGTVVVMHDRDLRRLGKVSVTVPGSAFPDLQDIDIGSWFAPEFSGQRIPTLEQVLDLCKGRARVNIELKYYGSTGTLAERVIEIVEERRMASDVVLMSLKHDAIRQAKLLRPEWKMGMLTAAAVGNLARLESDFLAVNASLATRSFIRSVHRRGREVHVWTVNDPLQMSVLISRGVDNIITDVPAVARTVLAERAAMTAVERLLVEVGAWIGIVPVEEESSAEDEA